MVLTPCLSFLGDQPHKPHHSIAIPHQKRDAFGLKGDMTHQALIEHQDQAPYRSWLNFDFNSSATLRIELMTFFADI